MAASPTERTLQRCRKLCRHCGQYVIISPDVVSAADKTRLETLGFDDDGEYFSSYRFGSA